MATQVRNRQAVTDALRTTSRPDGGVFDILSTPGRGVMSGGFAVTATGTGLQVAVASGTVVPDSGSNTSKTADGAGGNLTPATAPTVSGQVRIDLVVVDDSDGSESIVAGAVTTVTALTGPVWPTLASTQIPVAALHITDGLVTMDADHIQDLRVVTDPVRAPYQWLTSTPAASPQTIPDKEWTPIMWRFRVIDGLGTDRGYDALATTVAAASNGDVLPQGTITVASTTGFPTPTGAGEWIAIFDSSANVRQVVKYTGLTSTTFTGCTGGSITLATGDAVELGDVHVVGTSPGYMGDWYLLQQIGSVIFADDGIGIPADLNQTISNPPTQAEVQAISDKVDATLNRMRTCKRIIRKRTYDGLFNFVAWGNEQNALESGPLLDDTGGAQGVRLQMSGQPGPSHTGVGGHVMEVWQNSGSDLALSIQGIESPLCMQATYTAKLDG